MLQLIGLKSLTKYIYGLLENGTIFKVPFSFYRVPGSFTGEALCEELIQKISSVKVLKENAAEKLPDALRVVRKEFVLEIELKKLHLKMKVYILNITQGRKINKLVLKNVLVFPHLELKICC